MATPYATVTLGTVDSTQDEARVRLAAGEDPAVLVVAARQVGGRGRSGRDWVDAPRALAASLAFRPVWPSEAWPRLTLVAGLAAVGAVGDAVGVDVALKWPNDVVHPDNETKLGGILAESSGGVVVAGFGLNLYWPEPVDGAGALLAADPGPDVATVVADAWAGRLLERAAGEPDGWGVGEYRGLCVTVGEEISWEPGGTGRAVDVDPDGRLVVETGDGKVRLAAGEVRRVRPAAPDRGSTIPPGSVLARGGDEP